MSSQLAIAAALVPCALSFFAAQPASRRSQQVRLVASETSSSVDTAFATAAKKENLMEGLRREYESFFQPMEEDLYDPSVTFEDPLINLNGVDAYRNNVNMLAGSNPFGKLCFDQCGLTMHNVSELANGQLQTRWTLQFRFKLLPWQPIARFTGVSRYTLDSQCRVSAQQDYWDSVNMLPGGDYAPKEKKEALLDLLGQLAPGSAGNAQQASDKELPYVLLRRAAKREGSNLFYEVRRYPQHVSVVTDYFRRLDAFGTLGAYTNGANEKSEELQAYVPSLMSVPQDSRTMQQVVDDSLDLKPSQQTKEMRWPMAVPAMKEAVPPAPSGRLDGFARLDVVPGRTVAVLAFGEPTTEPNVRGFYNLLKRYLVEDGLTPSAGEETEQFRLAQVRARACAEEIMHSSSSVSAPLRLTPLPCVCTSSSMRSIRSERAARRSGSISRTTHGKPVRLARNRC